jgi:hypothetical protein
MSPLELKKVKLELVKVQAARCELEYRVEERLEEIDRIKSNIQIQLNKEAELQTKIAQEEQNA